MYNLIKMDLYRLFHSIATWITLALVVAVTFFSVGMAALDLSEMENDPAYAQSSSQTVDPEAPHFGIIIQTDPAWINADVDASELMGLLMNSGILLIFCSIFTALFVHAEQKSGYVKNIAGQLPNRGVLALSKFVAVAVLVFLLLTAYTLFSFVSGYLFFGSRLVFGSIAKLFSMLAVQFLLHLGFCAVIECICVLTKSAVTGMAAGLLLCSGLVSFLYEGISQLIGKIGDLSDFHLSRYMLDTNVYMTGTGAPPEQLLRAGLVAAAFLLAGVAVSMTVMRRRDIK